MSSFCSKDSDRYDYFSTYYSVNHLGVYFDLSSGYVRYCSNDNVAIDKHFNDSNEFVSYFLSSCGFRVGTNVPGVYIPGDTSSDSISVDKDRLNQKVKEADEVTADTVSTVLPGTKEKLDELQANPDAVMDITAEDIYTADIPAIDTAPALWTTKFPFCIPWDIYNLFSGFFTTSQCPKFTFVLMPENSFGLQNEEVTLTIDFSEYDTIVQIIRFFIAVFFVFGLIFATRKLVWSGG